MADGFTKRSTNFTKCVSGNGQWYGNSTSFTNHSGERVCIRVNDLARPQGFIDFGEFITCAENSDTWTLMHENETAPDGSKESDIGRSQYAPFLQHDLTTVNVFSTGSDVRTGRL